RRKQGDKGYQRILEKGRIGDIAKKIVGGNILAFPNAILLSCPDGHSLCGHAINKSDCPKHVKINVPSNFASCRIIDGQHRLLSFSRVEDRYQENSFLPVIILENIEQEL